MNGMISTLSENANNLDFETDYDGLFDDQAQGSETEHKHAVWPELTEMGQEMLAVLNGLYAMGSDDPTHFASAGV